MVSTAPPGSLNKCQGYIGQDASHFTHVYLIVDGSSWFPLDWVGLGNESAILAKPDLGHSSWIGVLVLMLPKQSMLNLVFGLEASQRLVTHVQAFVLDESRSMTRAELFFNGNL